MPFKVPIMRYLQDLTPAAKVLRAVNTVIPSTDGQGRRILLGDNTDWVSFCAPVEP
jgi:pentafunctional AROM polypeptide